MGLIVIVKDFEREIREPSSAKISNVTIDYGNGAITTGVHYADSGDDSYPLSTDYAIAVDTLSKGVKAVVGYADIINTPKAGLGEKRVYARDSSGASIGEVWLKSDGSVLLSNSNGSFELKADGSINMNGVTVDPTGNVVINGTLEIAGIDFATHKHSILSGSSAGTTDIAE